MTVSEASRDAYQALISQGISDQQSLEIMVALMDYPQGLTRREVSSVTGIETSSVAGRVNQLVKDGHLVELPRRACSITQKLVGVVALPSHEGSAAA